MPEATTATITEYHGLQWLLLHHVVGSCLLYQVPIPLQTDRVLLSLPGSHSTTNWSGPAFSTRFPFHYKLIGSCLLCWVPIPLQTDHNLEVVASWEEGALKELLTNQTMVDPPCGNWSPGHYHWESCYVLIRIQPRCLWSNSIGNNIAIFKSGQLPKTSSGSCSHLMDTSDLIGSTRYWARRAADS